MRWSTMLRTGLLVRAALREGRTAHSSSRSPVAVAPSTPGLWVGSGAAAATAAATAVASAAPTASVAAPAPVAGLLHGLAASVGAARAVPPSGGMLLPWRSAASSARNNVSRIDRGKRERRARGQHAERTRTGRACVGDVVESSSRV